MASDFSLSGLASQQMASTPVHVGIPVPERLTLQREANDIVELLMKAHMMLDMLTSAPTPAASQTPTGAPHPLSSAIGAAKSDLHRLCERLDGLVSAVGQI